MPSRTRVFISYSHDSEEHTQFVLELAERLLEDSFNCVLDFYLDETPSEGWQVWLEAELAAADFTLVICTPTYLQRYQHNQMLDNDAAEFAGLVITQDIYARFAKQTKFVPILPPDCKLHDIIPPLQGQNAFELMTDYLGLHQLLKNKQPKALQTRAEAVKWQDESHQAAKLGNTPAPPTTTYTNELQPQHTEKKQPVALYAALAVLALFLLVAIVFILF